MSTDFVSNIIQVIVNTSNHAVSDTFVFAKTYLHSSISNRSNNSSVHNYIPVNTGMKVLHLKLKWKWKWKQYKNSLPEHWSWAMIWEPSNKWSTIFTLGLIHRMKLLPCCKNTSNWEEGHKIHTYGLSEQSVVVFYYDKFVNDAFHKMRYILMYLTHLST